jgi:hypothetical protein
VLHTTITGRTTLHAMFQRSFADPKNERVLREMDTKGKPLSGNVIDVTSNMKELIFKQVMAQIFLIGIAADECLLCFIYRMVILGHLLMLFLLYSL